MREPGEGYCHTKQRLFLARHPWVHYDEMTLRHKLPREGFRQQSGEGQRDYHTFITGPVFLWPSGWLDELYIKSSDGPGIKESIKKMHWEADVGLYNAAANMLEARVAPALNHHYFEILENYLGPCRTLALGFFIFRKWRMREFGSLIGFRILVTLYIPAWVKFKSYQDKIEVL